jgi:hypothetical protein
MLLDNFAAAKVYKIAALIINFTKLNAITNKPLMVLMNLYFLHHLMKILSFAILSESIPYWTGNTGL